MQKALAAQLGLQRNERIALLPAKALVIAHIEKPAPN